MPSYPNNFARFPEEGVRPPHTHPIGDRPFLGGPALGSSRSLADPVAPRRGFLCPWSQSAGAPQALRSTLLDTPRPPHLPQISAGRWAEKAWGQTDVMGYTRKGAVPGVDHENAHSMRLTSCGVTSPARCPAPQPTPPPEPRNTSFALNLPRLGWAFVAPSSFSLLPPAEPFILLLAAARRPGPGIGRSRSGHPGWLAPGAHNGPPAASVVIVTTRRGVSGCSGKQSLKQEPRVVSLRRGLEVAVSAPLPPPHPVALRTRPEPEPASGAPSWGEVQAGAKGGAGPGCPGKETRLRREKETERRATSFNGVSGSWVLRGNARKRNASRN